MTFSRTALLACGLSVALLLCRPGSAPATELVARGHSYPEAAMPRPESAADLAYLGLSGPGDEFTLSQVEAEVVLVEILNVHCPHCQRQTPAYNELYQRLANDPATRGRIKMIGFAAGNNRTEVRDFRSVYAVPFPVIADPGFRMHRAIGGSRTPFSIYVRQDPQGLPGVVAGTHLGVDRDVDGLFARLQEILATSPAALRGTPGAGGIRVTAAPILPPDELRRRVEQALAGVDGPVREFAPVRLEAAPQVFTALVGAPPRERRLFAAAVSRPSVCDVCHDVHFIYLFDAAGAVLDFVPLQLTKWGNAPWNETDIAKMRQRLVGSNLHRPDSYHPEVDAVTSATITSALIFDALAQGPELMAALKAKGLL